RAQRAITEMLVQQFERRPYSRVAITSAGRADEPRLSVVAHGLADPHEIPPTEPLERCGITVSLTTAAEREDRGMQALLEVVSFLHDADVTAEDLVILDYAFRMARLERDPAQERSRCLADFTLTLLRD
ncbi:MAG TPA: hypothetical protein VIK87_12310, partial [Sphingomonadales bacterium]